MRKIVYIMRDPYWLRDHHRYGGEYLQENGYNVEIWHVITDRTISFEDEKRMYKGDNLFHYSWRDFRDQVEKNADAVFILQTYDRYYVYLKNKGCEVIVMSGLGAMIPRAQPKKVDRSLRGGLRRWKNRGIIKSIKLKVRFRKEQKEKRYYDSYVPKNPPDLIVTASHYTRNSYFHRNEPEERILYIHSQDYDRFIEANRATDKNPGGYILYIDSTYTGNAYDTAMTGISPGPEKHAEEYQRQLETVFEKMEEHFGMPVVISGHPHTIYPENAYSGREITFYKTCEQVRDAEYVIMQMSTAVSFPLLYDKPILMVANDYFRAQDDSRADLYEWMEKSAYYLGIGFINMSNPDELEKPWEKCVPADKNGRKDYIEKYLIDSDKTEKTIIEYLEEEYLSKRVNR